MMTSTALLGRAMLALAAMTDPPAVVENDAINALGETFRPYRTVAAWYLWRGKHLAKPR